MYLDDVGLKSSSPAKHLEDLRELFLVCRKRSISLKFEKCLLFVINHTWLGHVFGPQGISANIHHPHVVALAAMPYPGSVKEVLSFCGLMEFFSRYLDHLADRLVPLRRLIRKGALWDFNAECRNAFDEVKSLLMTAPVLKIPDRIHRFVASADASKFALGGVLEQFNDKGELCPVGYWSKTLSETQQNYPSYDRECLGQLGLWSFFRYLLLGIEIDAYGDCSAVTQLLNATDPHGRRARVFQGMSEFNAVMRHRPGVENEGPDCFSRLILSAVGVAIDSEYAVFDPSNDSSFPVILNYLSTGDMSGVKNDARFRRLVQQFVVCDQKLFRKAKTGPHLLVLFTKEDLFHKLRVLHDRMGHFSFFYIYKWVSQRWWRPHLGREVKDYCRGCDACQRFSLNSPKFSFNGQSAISGLFNNWYGDFLGPFPVSANGCRYVCIFVEPLSGFPEFEATADSTGVSAANMLEKEIICRYGVRGGNSS
jgi:hypothetical protein